MLDHQEQSDYVSASASEELGSVRSIKSSSWVGPAAVLLLEMVCLGSSSMDRESRLLGDLAPWHRRP